jgi:hypothetical protein
MELLQQVLSGVKCVEQLTRELKQTKKVNKREGRRETRDYYNIPNILSLSLCTPYRFPTWTHMCKHCRECYGLKSVKMFHKHKMSCLTRKEEYFLLRGFVDLMKELVPPVRKKILCSIWSRRKASALVPQRNDENVKSKFECQVIVNVDVNLYL